ncbi:MAG: family 20 glycosylhydrolase, partial [Candidatus Helarchaeota archaeon]
MKSLIIQEFQYVEKVNNYEFHLLPHPKEIVELGGYLEIKGKLHLHFRNVNNKDVMKERIKEELAFFTDFDFKEIEEDVEIRIEEDKFPKTEFEDEHYDLIFRDNSIIINASTDNGIFYGVNTFVQLIKKINNRLIIPKVDISDYPSYKIRAIADQLSRNQIPTIENLKKTIKFVSKYKLNYYFLYIEDAYNFEKYPDIGKARGGYNKEELKEIQNYAKRYFVEIVPIFNSFGHVDNILMTNHPKYADLGEFPGSACFDITNPKQRKFILELYDELCSTFESPLFHLGLDETFDFGKYNSKNVIKKEGAGKVLLDYYNYLIDAVKARGKTEVMFYHDNLLHEKKLLNDLPKDSIIFYWDYWPEKFFGLLAKNKYKKAKKIRDKGYRIILSPTLYDWTRNYPDTRLTIKNIVSMSKYGLEIGALGIVTSIWGDFLNENLRENNYFGIMVTADASWGPQDWDEVRFKKNYAWNFFGLDEYLDLFMAIKSLNIYNDSHMMYPTKFTSHIWRHPFPSKKIEPKVKKLKEIRHECQNALNIIKRLEPLVKRNKKNLRYMKYAANIGIYLNLKYTIPMKIQKELNKGRFELDSEEFISEITFLKNYISNLKFEYEILWRNAARPNGLKFLLEKFEAQALYYQQKIEQIKKEIAWEDPFLSSEFITHPKKVKAGNSIYLRKRFSVEKPIKKCHVQGMSDMLMHLYINGEKLGEIISKMSLSVEPIVQRIQFFDITDKIKQGDNIISAKCINYLIDRP